MRNVATKHKMAANTAFSHGLNSITLIARRILLRFSFVGSVNSLLWITELRRTVWERSRFLPTHIGDRRRNVAEISSESAGSPSIPR